jgi:hypothetical protein
MVWPHLHCERWATIECGKLKQVRNVMRKWIEDKWNNGVVEWVNNQVLALGLAHERRYARMISKGTSTKSEANFCSCKQFAKEAYNWG